MSRNRVADLAVVPLFADVSFILAFWNLRDVLRVFVTVPLHGARFAGLAKASNSKDAAVLAQHVLVVGVMVVAEHELAVVEVRR